MWKREKKARRNDMLYYFAPDNDQEISFASTYPEWKIPKVSISGEFSVVEFEINAKAKALVFKKIRNDKIVANRLSVFEEMINQK